jgi:hypothetical protein
MRDSLILRYGLRRTGKGGAQNCQAHIQESLGKLHKATSCSPKVEKA